MKPTIAVIGAGPAGISAALEASAAGAEVHLFDGNPNPGKKLLVTGSGRCNITNVNAASVRYYSGSHTHVLEDVFTAFPPFAFIKWLEQINIPTYQTDDGWVYPLSNSAANVADILTTHLIQRGVKLHTGTEIQKINPLPDGFQLTTVSNEKFEYTQLVVACGGKAYPNLGSKGVLFPAIEKLGHTLRPMFPALAPITTDTRQIRAIQGVRLDVRATLFHQDQTVQTTLGNIIFTDFGVNGPGVMDLSHHIGPLIAKNPKDSLKLEFDFTADRHPLLTDQLKQTKNGTLPIRTLLHSHLPPKLTAHVLNLANISADEKVRNLEQSQVSNLLNTIMRFTVQVTGVRGFEYSQVSTGGIPLEEIDLKTMKSRKNPRLFFAGEIVDITGPCGGYNLHWAFTSGILAGRMAGKPNHKQEYTR